MAAKRKARSLDDEPSASSPKKATKARSAKKSTKREPKAKVPTAADYVRDLRAMSGVEEADYAVMSDPLAWVSSVEEWLPTGSLAIDRLTGGGYPIGRIVEVAAWEGVGKSTMLDQSIAMAQSQGAVCVLIDSEQARDAKYTATLGVDMDSLIVHKASTIEDAFEGIDRVIALQEANIAKLAKSKQKAPPMLIVWDSMGGTPTKAEQAGAADDKHVASAAKAIKLNLKRMAARIANARVAFVFANQFYQDIGPFASIKTYGGSGVRYYTSLRVWLSRKGALKIGDRAVGHIIEAKLKKTRINKPQPPAELGLIYGAGLHNAYTLFQWGKTSGVDSSHRWIQSRGSWQWLMLPDGTHEAFQHQYIGFAEVLQNRPDVYEQMVTQYRAESSL